MAQYCKAILVDMDRRRGEIAFSEAARGYVRFVKDRANVRLTGLRRVMSAMLFNGNEEAADMIERSGGARRLSPKQQQRLQQETPSSSPQRAQFCDEHDMDHGRRVHQHMEHLIGALQSGAELWPLDDYDRCAMSAMWAMLRWQRLLPLFSEYTVDDPLIDVGTAIDIVAVDVDRGGVVLVEMKTGYSSRNYTRPSTLVRFRSTPFEQLSASPYTLHAMQATLAQAMLEQRYPAAGRAGVFRSVVMRISNAEDRTFFHPMPRGWGVAWRNTLYTTFSVAALARRKRPTRRESEQADAWLASSTPS